MMNFALKDYVKDFFQQSYVPNKDQTTLKFCSLVSGDEYQIVVSFAESGVSGDSFWFSGMFGFCNPRTVATRKAATTKTVKRIVDFFIIQHANCYAKCFGVSWYNATV